MEMTNGKKKKCSKCNIEGFMVIIWKGVERYLKCYQCGYEEAYPVTSREAQDWK